ncbi:Fe(3+)-hydroxamate ABC transporter permease FhuB [Pleomorphomonas oryzae]|uniref:Fe(3+)-hydroxamate ABC transporter permease FhuB n=1 Tax=Pleomorphomonas oryzae TaxID=261934 RepID=UPI0003F81F0F|nr:Fe(3+)-hydroxamate ABC transporter permease FhuB [Pleomorphomonas oryzae]
MALAGWLAWAEIGPLIAASAQSPVAALMLMNSALPRLAVALLSGMALGLSGALFQLVLKNPLASPATLGVSAGANLALVIAMLFAPALMGFGRDVVALAGSGIAAGIVLRLGARRDFSPFVLILAGLIVSLWCGALAAILILMNDHYVAGLFIWGAGSLSQQSWDPALSLLPKLMVAALLAGLMIRPLSLMEAGDVTAAALGARVPRLRFLAITIAVVLAALVTSTVGVISFVGLVAPALARLSGARRPAGILVWSSVFGAGLLAATDGLVLWTTGAMKDFVPTGAVTAVIGAPLLLALLGGLKAHHRPLPSARPRPLPAQGLRRGRGRWIWLAAGFLLLLALALLVGRAPLTGGWSLPAVPVFGDILALRLPRVVAALSAGAMLAVAGVILQRLTGNELASPEVLGISAGSTVGVTVLLFVAVPTLPLQLVAASLGALAVLAAIFALGLGTRFEPERLLMAGVALSALVDAVCGVIAVNGDPRAMILLRWMSGSTYSANLTLSLTVLAVGLLLTTAALAMRRWLDILPLGSETASGVGIDLGRARFLLFLVAGILSGAATLAAGPLSFAGLMGPHIARELGLKRAGAQIVGGGLAGAGILVLADWAGRNLAFPYEMPAGLVAALIGTPLLLALIRRR